VCVLEDAPTLSSGELTACFFYNREGDSLLLGTTCLFGLQKFYDEVNSVKNTTINIWLNDGVY